MNPQAHQGRLQHLDGLRGLAAIIVLCQHALEFQATIAPPDAWPAAWLAWTFEYLDFGKLGVITFFAISGFIIPLSFRGASPRFGFVVSRFFRLYPAYWLSLACAVLILPLIGLAPFGGRQILANATMLQKLLHQPDVLGVYWTLLVELIFYGLCFLLFPTGFLRSARALAVIIVVLLATSCLAGVLRGRGIGVPVSLLLNLAVMFLGSFLRMAILEGDAFAKRFQLPLVALLFIVIPIAWNAAYDDNSHKESVLADVNGYYFGFLFFVYGIRSRAFSTRFLVWLGAISYSIYLFHPIGLELGKWMALQTGWPLGGFVLPAVALVLTIGVSHVVHHLVELPSTRLGKRVASFRLASS